MKRVLLPSFLSILSLLYGGNALASTTMKGLNPISSFYAGASKGYSVSYRYQDVLANADKQAFVVMKQKIQQAGAVYGGYFGYDLTPYFASEAGYLHLPSLGLKQPNGSRQNSFDNNNDKLLYLAARISYPLNQRVSVEAKGGYAVTIDKQTDDGSVSQGVQTYNNPLLGAGVNFHPGQHFGMNANYTAILAANNGYPACNLFMGGLNYYF